MQIFRGLGQEPLYVKRYDLATAIARFDAALNRLVIKIGAEDKYHKTVTWFFLLLISDRVEKDQSWPEFCRNNLELTGQDTRAPQPIGE